MAAVHYGTVGSVVAQFNQQTAIVKALNQPRATYTPHWGRNTMNNTHRLELVQVNGWHKWTISDN